MRCFPGAGVINSSSLKTGSFADAGGDKGRMFDCVSKSKFESSSLSILAPHRSRLLLLEACIIFGDELDFLIGLRSRRTSRFAVALLKVLDSDSTMRFFLLVAADALIDGDGGRDVVVKAGRRGDSRLMSSRLSSSLSEIAALPESSLYSLLLPDMSSSEAGLLLCRQASPRHVLWLKFLVSSSVELSDRSPG